MSSGASLSLPDGLLGPHELVRELGDRPNPAYVVRQSGAGAGGKAMLAVAERFAGVMKTPAGEPLARDARRIATLASPNVARVREVVVRGDDLVVISEFVEGEKLQEIWRPEKLPLELALRVIVDALTGLGALHNLRDAKQQPMKLAHGEVSPATIVFGLDGIARLLCSVSRRAPGVEAELASHRYLSPEVAAGDAYDARAEVFSVGVLLWEALSGKRLFADPDPRANARLVRAGPLPRATVPEKAAWAKGLVEVVVKALSAAPDDRWPTAAVMAAEVRKAAGLKLAPASTAASFARSAFGERVKARRESLDAGSLPGRTPQPAPVAVPEDHPTVPPKGAKEPSFIDADLESVIETVQVAPGVRAPVEEAVELESDALLDAASERPPPPAPADGGFVLDPFAAGAMARSPGTPAMARPTPPPAQSPPAPAWSAPSPPAPPVATAPVVMLQGDTLIEEPAPPSVTGAPHFAAAIDLPPPTVPTSSVVPAYTPQALPPSPPRESQTDEVDVVAAGARRRKFIVLGGVGALGLLVFLLAAVRLATREPDATPTATRPPATSAAAVTPPAPSPTIAPSSVVPAAVAPPVSPPAVATATKPTATARPALAPAPRPTPVVAAAATPHAAPATHAPAATKPRPKPTFDPNSL